MGARLPRTLLTLLLSACADSIQLGTECAGGHTCSQKAAEASSDSGAFEPTPGRTSSTSTVDGGSVASLPPQSSVADSGAENGFSRLSLRNPSFEAVAGQSGSFALINISPSATLSVAPWQPCQLLNVGLSDVLPGFLNFAAFAVQPSIDLGTSEAPNLVLPTDGLEFVSVSFPSILPTSVAVPLSQPLDQPLVSGARYAFSVALRQLDPAPENSYTLKVYASNQSCAPNGPSLETREPLASVSVPNNGKWETACVTFTAEGGASDFMLVAGTSAAATIGAVPGFAMDNIQVNDGSCANH
jgi:hypothetical protein